MKDLNRIVVYLRPRGWLKKFTVEEDEDQYRFLDRINQWMRRQVSGIYRFRLWFGPFDLNEVGSSIESEWIGHDEGEVFDLIEKIVDHVQSLDDLPDQFWRWVTGMKEGQSHFPIGYPIRIRTDEEMIEWEKKSK